MPQQEEGGQGNQSPDDDGTTHNPGEENAGLLHFPVQEVEGGPPTEDVVQRSPAGGHGVHIIGTGTDYTSDNYTYPLMCRLFGHIPGKSVLLLLCCPATPHSRHIGYRYVSVDSLILPSPIPCSVPLIAGVLHSHHSRPPANEAAMEALRSMVLHNSAISNAVSAVCRIKWQGCVLHNVVLCCRGHVCKVNTQDFGRDSKLGKLASNWSL